MTAQTSRWERIFIRWTLAAFFGWLLSVPLNGGVLQALAEAQNLPASTMALVFIAFHAAGLLACGFLLRPKDTWRTLMITGASLAAAAALALFVAPRPVWFPAMAVMGVAASLYVIGWSYPYTRATATGRIRFMAGVMVWANLIYLSLHALSLRLPVPVLCGVSMLPLAAALALPLLAGPGRSFPGSSSPARREPVFPAVLLVILGLFIFGVYLNGGFMYAVIFPAVAPRGDPAFYSGLLAYMAVLLAMSRAGHRLETVLPAYLGASFLGLSFVSFALLAGIPAGDYLTVALVQGAFALLDLFVWVVLGEIAFIFGRPGRIFGSGLFVNVAAILVGQLMAGRLLLLGSSYRMITALFAAAAILMTYLTIPWLSRHLNAGLQNMGAAPGPDQSGEEELQQFVQGKMLTPREREIIEQILKGYTNRDIAARLYISENTLKTHLKHIYQKFGVAQKRELLSMALGQNRSSRRESPEKVIDRNLHD